MGCTKSTATLVTENETTQSNEIIINKKSSIHKAKTNKDTLDIDDFINQMLKLHNDERKKNNSNELKLNEALNLLATEYSENLISKQEKVKFKNYMFNGIILGENIAFSETKEAKKIFELWLKKDVNYEKTSKKFLKANAHYTQIIWKNTTEVGISICHDVENKKYCTVVLYNPPGNTLGSFPENI